MPWYEGGSLVRGSEREALALSASAVWAYQKSRIFQNSKYDRGKVTIAPQLYQVHQPNVHMQMLLAQFSLVSSLANIFFRHGLRQNWYPLLLSGMIKIRAFNDFEHHFNCQLWVFQWRKTATSRGKNLWLRTRKLISSGTTGSGINRHIGK